MHESSTNRRDFFKSAFLLGSSLLATQVGGTPQTNVAPFVVRAGSTKSKINLGIIGTGLRGRDHLEMMLYRTDVQVIAICDIDPAALAESQKILSERKQPKAEEYGSKGDRDYLRLLERKDLDAVLIATPWKWHSEMAVASLKHGIYTATEVCGGFSIDECWELVRAHEETGAHLFFLENVCYRRDVMAILNMVRQQMFGEIIHLEGGYQHDLRAVKFNDGKQPYGGGVEFGAKGFSEARWRTENSIYRNGDLYPTHGIGPVANFININRGNRFLYLTSMASKARGLHDYVVNHPKGGANHASAQVDFKLGDVVTTLIKCNNGETVLLSHDTNLPRPYSLGFRVQGTKGLWMDINQSVMMEGVTAKAHRWEKQDDWLKKYDHPLWQKYEKAAEKAGHGGMDFFVDNAFVECVKAGIPAVLDVYDAATWLAITPLSETSIATGSVPQPFPDFTRGRWMSKQVDFALNDLF